MSTSQFHPQWNNLIAWLIRHGMRATSDTLLVEARPRPGAGYGLFALATIPPSTPLFAIPASALLNVATLSPHYPLARKMTAVQLISLHLLLHRPEEHLDSLDPLFGPYISILPRNFDSHPLTWYWKRDKSLTIEPTEDLLGDLPISVMHGLDDLAVRFYADWNIVQQYLQDIPGSQQRDDLALEQDYLWAWLNVNTRCIHHRLRSSRSHSDNMTMCPILDFANHTASALSMLPLSSHAEIWDMSPRRKIGDDFTLLSPADVITQPGHELYLKYGAHANKTLFVEYGFVNHISTEGLAQGDVQGEIDVQEMVEPLFGKRGELGRWMKEQLTDEGYWGEWTLHSWPQPAHPSFRLMTALRLYCLMPASHNGVPDENLVSWRDTLLGKRDIISAGNEISWRNTLLQICESLIERATEQTAPTNPVVSNRGHDNWVGFMRESIRLLWEEERYVANAVAESIRGGVQF